MLRRLSPHVSSSTVRGTPLHANPPAVRVHQEPLLDGTNAASPCHLAGDLDGTPSEDHDSDDDEDDDEDEDEDDDDDDEDLGKWEECVVCCESFLTISEDRSEDPMDTSQPGVVKGCQECGMKVCGDCMAEMFVGATKDPTRMPPKCCKIYGIHLARPYLTDAQASAFREKFDEWVSSKKVYCPSLPCSAFIAERHRPDPTVQPTYSCPQNETHVLCSKCHGFNHPGVSCATSNAHSDGTKETLRLIDAWGYKQCPRCGTAVKRMYGCPHMQCFCGAHFCWGCLKLVDQCEDPQECSSPGDSVAVNDGDSQSDENLDSRRAQDWMVGFDFGEEPTPLEDSDARAWSCNHHLIELHWFETDLDGRNCLGDELLECSRCWTHLNYSASSDQMITPAPCSAYHSRFSREAWNYNARPCSLLQKGRQDEFDQLALFLKHTSPPTQSNGVPPTPKPTNYSPQDAWTCTDCGLMYCRGCVLGTKPLKAGMCGMYETKIETKKEANNETLSETTKQSKKRPRSESDPSTPGLGVQH